MTRTRARARLLESPFAWFLLAAATVYATCTALVRTAGFAANSDLGWFAITFDLSVTVPFLYYLLIVRTGRGRAMTLIPVVVLSHVAARALVPAAHAELLRQFAILMVPLEIAIIVAVVLKVRSARHACEGEDDIVERIDRIMATIIGEGRPSRIAASEVTAIYLTFAGWRLPAPATRGIASSTFYRRDAWGTVVAGFILLLAAEAIAVHLFIQQWSVAAAWTVTALELWGVVWIIGDYQAFRLRPSVLTDEALELRFGFRWWATIPRDRIASIEPVSEQEAETMRKSRDYLRMAIFEEPSHLIRLHEAVEFRGMAGFTRHASVVGIRPDEMELVTALETLQGPGSALTSSQTAT